ncbi:hypothetical protein [Paenibacillus wynnii]|uniref:Amino acid transporter n=1 Tax=Paenibacillus wynnii TaxID=268407 RepID=A0A098M982_9BACL|nr:hypothetical protein [Paenibacillus wynnii]KGE18087.1 hypothetical protein PWYN_26495 [Paenibacillus wynnii]
MNTNSKDSYKIHETERKMEVPVDSNSGYKDEKIRLIQQIESGGLPKKIDLNHLPGPLKYVGYAIVFGIPVLFLILIVVSFIK